MLFALWFSFAAQAQEAVKLQVVHTVQKGGSPPALVILPQVQARSLDVSAQCGGISQSHSGPAAPDQPIRMEFKLPVGTYQCTGSLKGEFADGGYGEMPLSFEVRVLPTLDASVTKDDLDLEAQYMNVAVNQSIDHLSVRVYGPGGQELGQGQATADVGSLGPHRLEWRQTPGEVVQLKVTIRGTSGVETYLDLYPWSYAVPHEDVNFATGSHDITPEEDPKLLATMGEIEKVLEKYGTGVGGYPVPIQLYVAGYTDTVGSASSNKQLSERRARSIALWYKAHGFSRPIFTQGFGEKGLIRPTADQVDDAANRRAVYILSAQAPPTSALLPAEDWRPLN